MNCFMCKGTMKPDNVNHVVDINQSIIIVKDVPALKCKQCGDIFFEDENMEKLEKIVDKAKNSNAEITVITFYHNVA